jgi:hypothetical protein
VACAACGGSNLTCDDPQPYQLAREGLRINAPDDLDDLQASQEIPVPKASPREPRPQDSTCLDLPPTVQAENLN